MSKLPSRQVSTGALIRSPTSAIAAVSRPDPLQTSRKNFPPGIWSPAGVSSSLGQLITLSACVPRNRCPGAKPPLSARRLGSSAGFRLVTTCRRIHTVRCCNWAAQDCRQSVSKARLAARPYPVARISDELSPIANRSPPRGPLWCESSSAMREVLHSRM